MNLIDTSVEELKEREQVAFRRFLAVVTETPSATPVADGAWNAGQVAAHVLTVFRRYNHRDLTSPTGLSKNMADLDAQNQAELDAVSGLTHAEVVDELTSEQKLLENLELDPATTYPFHFGQTIDVFGGWGNAIGELLVHGHDVARATGRRWPIAPRDALLVMNANFQVAAGAVSPEAAQDMSATFEFRVRGGRPQTLAIERGDVAMLPSSLVPGRPDVVLAGPPVPFLLNLYGRLSTPGAALRGVGIRGGRRPWLGLRLARVFETPIG